MLTNKNFIKFVSYTVVIFFFAGNNFSTAQHKVLPLNRLITSEVERSVVNAESVHHTAWKPFVEDRFDLSIVNGFKKDTAKYYYLITELLWKSNLVKLKTEDLVVTLDPVFDFSYTSDFADQSPYADTIRFWNNTRGLRVEADIDKFLSVQATIVETQSYFVSYLKAISDTLQVVPGLGRWKRYRTSGFDYGMSTGMISLAPAKWLNVQFGHGKNFIGNGYRSLLLSDVAYNYPYLKSTMYFFNDKVQYTAMWAQLQSLERLPTGEVPESLFKKKIGSFYYLSWTPSPAFEIGLFEGVVWQHWDSTGVQPPNPAMIIPVIGLGTVLNGLDSKNNAMAGVNARVKLYKGLSVYGQFVIDQEGKDGNGYQVGIRYYDCLIPGFDLQFEYNKIANNVYRSSVELQNYGHFNQPLGSVTGPGSQEYVGIINYGYKKFISEAKFNWVKRNSSMYGSLDVLTGADIPLGEMQVNYVQQWEIQGGIKLNPKTNMQLMLGFTDRIQRPGEVNHHTSAVFMTFRTNLLNRYFDF